MWWSLTGWNEPQLMALSRDGTLWATNRFGGQVMLVQSGD